MLETMLVSEGKVAYNPRNVNYISSSENENYSRIALNDLSKTKLHVKMLDVNTLYQVSDTFLINLDNVAYIDNYVEGYVVYFLNNDICYITEKQYKKLLEVRLG